MKTEKKKKKKKKEIELLELQITQTRHPLFISDGKMSKFNTRQK